MKEKRLNRGGGYGLDIPVIYTYNRQEQAIELIKSKIQGNIKLDQSIKFFPCLLIGEKNRTKSSFR